MTRHLLLLLLASLLLTGCVAAGAGAVAGSEAAKGQLIDYYLITNDVTSEVEEAMQDQTVVEGMTAE